MDIKEQVKRMTSELNEKFAALEENRSKMGEDLKKEVENELMAKTSEVAEEVKSLQSQIDELSRREHNGNGANKKAVSFSESLEKAISANIEKIKHVANGGVADMTIKAPADMTVGNSTTGDVLSRASVPGISGQAFESVRVRDLVGISNSVAGEIRATREVPSDREGAFAPVAEGDTKPQIDWVMEGILRPKEDIAGFATLSNRMLKYIDFITDFITTTGVGRYLDAEDEQLLFGDGVSPNLFGIATEAVAFAAGGIVVGASANRADVLLVALNQVRLANAFATAILVNPADYTSMILEKDANNNYIFGHPMQVVTPNIAGVPLLPHNSVTPDNFIVGDFVRGVQTYQDGNINVRFFEEHATNVTSNETTVRIENSVSNVVTKPWAFVAGDFTTAIADLQS